MTEPTDLRVLAVLDVIAPHDERFGGRFPIFEWPHETTPTDDEMVELTERIVRALDDV